MQLLSIVNGVCLFIFIRRKLELKKIYKELVISLIVWDLVFIVLGTEMFKVVNQTFTLVFFPSFFLNQTES